MRRHQRGWAAAIGAAFACLALAGCASQGPGDERAAPPPDAAIAAPVPSNAERVRAANERFFARQEEILAPYAGRPIAPDQANLLRQQLAAEADLALADIDLERLGPKDRREISALVAASPAALERLRSILLGEAQRGGAAGFVADIDSVVLDRTTRTYARSGEAGDAFRERIKALLRDPRATAALRSGEGTHLGFLIRDLDATGRREIAPVMLDIASTFDGSEPLSGCQAITMALKTIRPEASPAAFERARQHLADAFAGPASTAGADADAWHSLHALITGAGFRGPLVGSPAPDGEITLQAADGSSLSKRIADFRGRVLVLDFGATWCSACVASLPKMNELQRAFPGDDVTILWVFERDAKTTDAELYQFARSRGAEIQLALCDKQTLFEEYGIFELPSAVIVGREGRVEAVGLHPMLHDGLRQAIERARNRPSTPPPPASS
jgi:thiol-disulfide isomerase/thioredoxin